MTTSHFEKLLEKLDHRCSVLRDKRHYFNKDIDVKIEENRREYERIRAQYAKETKEREE